MGWGAGFPWAVLSGLLLAAAFPPLGLGALAWIALVPLLLALRGVRPARALLLGGTAGLVFHGLVPGWTLAAWWSGPAVGLNPANYALATLFSAAFPAVFALLACWLGRRHPAWVALSWPATWLVVEYARSNLGWLAMPLGVIGYSQDRFLLAAQLAAFSGVYGVSFLLVASNAALALCVRLAVRSGVPALPASAALGVTACGGGLLNVALPGTWDPAPSHADRKLHVTVVQAGAAGESGPTPRALFQRYRRLTREAEPQPGLVVWQKAALPVPVPASAPAALALASVARESGAALLVGTGGLDKRRPGRERARGAANSAVLFSADGRLLGRYDKMRLLPFNEYVPLREHVPWPAWVGPDIPDAVAGSEPLVFDLGGSRLGVRICWENFFPGAFRTSVREGAELMMSLTNEAFTDRRAAHDQMLAMNVFRAIENRVAVVRAATTGVSAIIAPSGRIVARVEDAGGRDVDVEGVISADVPLRAGGSFYTRHGDWLVALCALLLLIAAAVPPRAAATHEDGVER
jgi:apolipoprotein N-acyltransferase